MLRSSSGKPVALSKPCTMLKIAAVTIVVMAMVAALEVTGEDGRRPTRATSYEAPVRSNMSNGQPVVVEIMMDTQKVGEILLTQTAYGVYKGTIGA